MAQKTGQRDSAAEHSEIDSLNQIRLERNWTYSELSADMARTGFEVPAKTLQNLIVYRPNKPYDRTLFQIRRYLDRIEEEAVRATEATEKAAAR